jgi:predicted SAM-dependent methyltransferase
MKLHLGAGPHIKSGWINYDLNPHVGGVKHDLTQPLPHADLAVDEVFSEHFIEHINRDQGLALLKECYRTLKIGGKLRITTPNLKVLTSDYLNGKIDRWKGGWEPSTPCQMMNYGMTSWGHQFTYDPEELLLLFKEAGFKDAKVVEHQRGVYECRFNFSEFTVEAYKD